MAQADPVTVFGSFGFGNLGDELVPQCFANLLRAAGRTDDVQAMTRFDKVTHGDAAPFPGDAGAVALGARTLVLSGGGIVEARAKSCMNKAFSLKATAPDLRVAAHAISVEPGVRFSWKQRRALRQQVEHIGRVNVRDSLSAEVLSALVPNHPIRVIGDIALWIEPQDVPADLEALTLPDAIPVILADVWQGDDFYDWLTTELAELSRRMKRPLMMLPFSQAHGKDMKIHGNVRDRLAQAAPDVKVVFPLENLPFERFTPEVVAGLLARAPLTVSMRLHGCVMSYAVRTPFVGIAYHPKLRGFCETVGMPAALAPQVLPKTQSPGSYGYDFGDLNMEKGLLSARAEAVLEDSDFSAIAYFRRLQITALTDTLDRS